MAARTWQDSEELADQFLNEVLLPYLKEASAQASNSPSTVGYKEVAALISGFSIGVEWPFSIPALNVAVWRRLRDCAQTGEGSAKLLIEARRLIQTLINFPATILRPNKPP